MRSKKQTRKKPVTSKSRAVDVAVVEVLEVEVVDGVEIVSDTEEEVPTEEATENDFPPELGGEE